MLLPVIISEDDLRAAFMAADEEYDFASLSADGLEDADVVHITSVISEFLGTHPINAHFAGDRINALGQIQPPSEIIDVSLLADADSIIGSYQWEYSIFGERQVTLATTTSEWRDLHSNMDSDGIDGAIELAGYICWKISNCVADANRFFEALR